MNNTIRKSKILEEIDENGSVEVGSLADSMHVSPMTIRRDLRELERNSLVRRVHGGAVAGRARSYEPPYLTRSEESIVAKRRIGEAAALLIAEGDSIAIDTGTTCLQVAESLKNRSNLTIITNNLRSAEVLEDQPFIRVVLTGGIIRSGERSLVGDLAINAFNELRVDRLVLSAGALDANFGISEYNWDDATVKKKMIQAAKETILVIDSSKFGKVAFARVAGLESISTLVTDREPDPRLSSALRKADVKVIIAPQGNTTKAHGRQTH